MANRLRAPVAARIPLHEGTAVTARVTDIEVAGRASGREGGLFLCNFHHVAYDGAIIGIRPDPPIEVAAVRCSRKATGAVLRHGRQGLHGQ
jgi:hypothetical protein